LYCPYVIQSNLAKATPGAKSVTPCRLYVPSASPLFIALNQTQDSEQASQSSQFINYFDVSNNFAWRETRLTEIEQRRALLGDTLIFDFLLLHGGIQKPDGFYPPSDVSALQQLLGAIEASHYDTLKKECLVYYLLKWHQDGREGRFQLDRCIPPHFAALADAYWLLDTGANVPVRRGTVVCSALTQARRSLRCPFFQTHVLIKNTSQKFCKPSLSLLIRR